jgi:hypothetical protein
VIPVLTLGDLDHVVPLARANWHGIEALARDAAALKLID